MTSPITTHILDTALGQPAAGVRVTLKNAEGKTIRETLTDGDGRVRDLMGAATFTAGEYELVFAVAGYFAATGRESFYPQVVVRFTITDTAKHHHVPLLISPFGYSTYRGS